MGRDGRLASEAHSRDSSEARSRDARLARFTREDHAYGVKMEENDCFAVYLILHYPTLKLRVPMVFYRSICMCNQMAKSEIRK